MYVPCAFCWDSSFDTGYEKIDNQHRQIVTAINNLMEASKPHAENTAIAKTLEFLSGYTIKHFADEEKLQLEYHYPDYRNHKQLHEDFKAKVILFVERMNKEGPTEKLINEVCSITGDWLFEHIKGEDFRLAAFIKAADAKAPEKNA